jgi:hypothetical protein
VLNFCFEVCVSSLFGVTNLGNVSKKKIVEKERLQEQDVWFLKPVIFVDFFFHCCPKGDTSKKKEKVHE